jgi:hypothetical protein
MISTLNTVLLVAVSGLGVISARLKIQVMTLQSEKPLKREPKKPIQELLKSAAILRSRGGKHSAKLIQDDALPRDKDGDLMFLETPRDKHDKSESDGYIDAISAKEEPQTNKAPKSKINKIRRFSKIKITKRS